MLGFAAVNALSRHLFDRKGFAPLPAAGSLGELDLQTGDHLGMIGLFPPLVSQVRASGARLTVPELRADLAGAGDGASVTLDAGELAHCNKVLSSSTVLINDTIDASLDRCCRLAERFALIGAGPGACLSRCSRAASHGEAGAGSCTQPTPGAVSSLSSTVPGRPMELEEDAEFTTRCCLIPMCDQTYRKHRSP